MTQADTQAALRALLRDKVHVRPDTLARLPSAQAEAMRTPTALARLLLQPLAGSAPGLLYFWAQHRRGHAVVNAQRHEYTAGRQMAGRRTLDGVAWVAARRLLAEPALSRPLAHLLDHLLGSDGEPGGHWLSDGGGRTVAWAEAGVRLQRQFSLGYAPGQVAADPHLYFAWGLRLYLADRPALNMADPGLERLLATTIFQGDFWSRAEG